MHRILLISFFLFSHSVFANPRDLSDQQALDYMKTRLPFGVYAGTHEGVRCFVDVSSGPTPGYGLPSAYKVMIMNYGSKDGWYSLWIRKAGGRGDCPLSYIEDTNKGDYFQAINQGSHFPCFSHPMKSNRRGLVIAPGEHGFYQVKTLDEQGQVDAQCTLDLP